MFGGRNSSCLQRWCCSFFNFLSTEMFKKSKTCKEKKHGTARVILKKKQKNKKTFQLIVAS